MSVLVKAASQADVADIKAKTDNLADQILTMDFWSDVDDGIDLPVGPTNTALPDIVVSGLPSGITLQRVVAMLKVRAIENTNGGGANAINGAQNIQVRKSGGSWVPAINLANNQWTVAASTREAGDILVGDNDLKTTVDGDATYNFQFALAAVDLASLRLNDVLVGLRVSFSSA
ncbi:hypothetical protein ES703_64683 [subsurface metagenome]